MTDNIEEKQKNLGCKVIFAGSDLGGFTKDSNDESENVVSNCNIKMVIKTSNSSSEE
jgi:hypothetical protein